MPIYEYQCGFCHIRFERRQRFDEEPVCSCPRCQGKARRVLHSVPVFFKGSGFYSTDSRRGYSGASGSSSKKEEEPTAKEAEGTALEDKK